MVLDAIASETFMFFLCFNLFELSDKWKLVTADK